MLLTLELKINKLKIIVTIKKVGTRKFVNSTVKKVNKGHIMKL